MPMTTDHIPEKFMATLNIIIDGSREIIETEEELFPIVFLCKSTDICPVLLDFPDDAGKEFSSMMIAQIAKDFCPEYTIFVSEAWVLKADNESEAKRDKTQSLEHHPDRLDCVMFSLETCHGIWLGRAEIKKNANNQRTIGKPVFEKPVKATGRFVNLLVTNEIQ